MKQILKLLVAVALPMALVSGGAASAQTVMGKGGAKAQAAVQTKGGAAASKVKKGPKKMFGFIKALIKDGALPPSALTRMTGLQGKIKSCYQAAKAAKKLGKVECRSARIALVKARAEVYQSAKPKDPKHVAKLAKNSAWAQKTLARIKANQAKHKAAPATPVTK